MKTILFYGTSLELNTLRQIANEAGIKTIAFGDEALENTLASAFTFEQDTLTTCNVFPHEYMIMDEIGIDLMSSLLKKLDERGLEFEGIKVMRTEANQSWQLYDLLQETSSEHAVMKKAVLLETVIKSTNNMDFETLLPDVKKQLQTALMNGYMLLTSGQYDEEQLDKALNELSDALKNTGRVVQ